MNPQSKPTIKNTVYTNDLFVKKSDKGSKWIIGDLDLDTHFLLPLEQKSLFDKICTHLNGEFTVSEISSKLKISESSVNQILSVLQSKGMLLGEDENISRFNEVDNLSFHVITHYFKKISENTKKIANIISKILLLIFIVNLLILILNFTFFYFGLNTHVLNWSILGESDMNNWLDYLIINVGMILMFFFHELGHVLQGINQNIQPEKFSFVLYLGVIPMFYIKNKNIYSLKRNAIIMILFAGIAMNLLLGLICINIFFFTGDNIFKLMALSNFRIILVNLFPLSLSDGYFIFSILTKRPNLRFKLHSFIANPTIIKTYTTYESFYVFITYFILIITMIVEIMWLLSLVHINGMLKITLAIWGMIVYLFVIHLVNKKKLMK